MEQSAFKRKVITTNDGSSSVFIEELDEHYHSIHGAIQEAIHVFLRMGLDHVKEEPVHILEVGFGTGLNCLLTSLTNRKVFYHGIEAYPIGSDLISSLNYVNEIENSEQLFSKIHDANWGLEESINENFTLFKHKVRLEEVELESKYNLIYFDAFGPRAQGELWHVDYFRKIYEALKPGGIFVTYCAKGQVRRDLMEVGFTMERLPGPPGKREMLRGVKNEV
jgi:tRNA U34 5-methylaminomethyl-2-thiouridine-forming methyltransferase MnmC